MQDKEECKLSKLHQEICQSQESFYSFAQRGFPDVASCERGNACASRAKITLFFVCEVDHFDKYFFN